VADDTYTLLITPGVSGPVGLVSGQPSDEDIRTAGAIVASYGKGKSLDQVNVLTTSPLGEKRFVVKPMPRDESQKLIV